MFNGNVQNKLQSNPTGLRAILTSTYCLSFGQSLGQHAVLKRLDAAFAAKSITFEAYASARTLSSPYGPSQKARPPFTEAVIIPADAYFILSLAVAQSECPFSQSSFFRWQNLVLSFGFTVVKSAKGGRAYA